VFCINSLCLIRHVTATGVSGAVGNRATVQVDPNGRVTIDVNFGGASSSSSSAGNAAPAAPANNQTTTETAANDNGSANGNTCCFRHFV